MSDREDYSDPSSFTEENNDSQQDMAEEEKSDPEFEEGVQQTEVIIN